MNLVNQPWTKVLSLGCILGGIALGAGTASAELLTYEGFTYERRQWSETSIEEEGIAGLDGGFGWAGPWIEHANPGGDEFTGIAAEPRDLNDEDGFIAGARTKALSFNDSQGRQLITTPGQARTSVYLASWSSRNLARSLGEPGETIWVSFLAQAGADADNYSFVSLDTTTASSVVWLGRVNSAPMPTHWGWQKHSGDAPTWADPGPLTTEQVFYLAKLEYPLIESDPLDISIWFNPDLGSESELGEPAVVTSANNQRINAVVLRGRNSIDFDELRIGTTFASVTPHGPFSEDLRIHRAVSVEFDTEAGRGYQVLLENGEDWERLLPAPLAGDGTSRMESFDAAIASEALRVVAVSEDRTPNPAANPVLPALEGLALHMDASAIDSMTLENDFFVTEWRDAQNAPIAFTPLPIVGETTSPVYFDSNFEINNRAAVLFDADSLDTQSPAGLGLANDIEGITFFSVVMNAQSASQNIFRMSTKDGDVGIRFVQFRRSADLGMNVRRLDDGSFHELYGGVREANVWGIDSSMTDYNTAQAFLYQNGAEVAFDDAVQTPGRSDPSDSMVVRIGSSTRPELANTWQGGIAEILFFNRALSNDERNQVGTYLSDKYNLPYTLSLETDVPFDVVETVTLSFRADAETEYAIDATNDLAGSWTDTGIRVTGVGFNERTFVTVSEGTDREFFRARRLAE